MNSDQLHQFVKECRENNIPDKEIIKNLQEHGWTIEIIQQILNVNLSVNSPAKKPVKIETIADFLVTNHPLIIKIVSIFFFLIAGLYYFSSFGMTVVLLMMNYSVSKAFNPLFVVIKAVPILGLLPIITLLGGSIIVYAGIKIRQGSKSSLWFGLISLGVIIGIFIILQIVTNNSMIKIQTNSNQL